MRWLWGPVVVVLGARTAMADAPALSGPPQQLWPPGRQAQPEPAQPAPPVVTVERVSVELVLAAGGPLLFPTTGRIGIGIDLALLPILSVHAAIANSGGDGWSGAQYSAAVRVHTPRIRGRRSTGAALGLAVGPYGYRPVIGEFDANRWDRAYFLRLQISTESTGRFHTRWFGEINGVLNRDDATCPDFGFCRDGGTVIIGGGVAIAFGLL